MKRSLIFFFLCCLSVACLSEEPSLKKDHPEIYTVTKGDTLWDISQRFLNNPWMWPEIWHVNPEIKNPHLIYPGDVLKLVYIDGKPQLVLDYSKNGSRRGGGGSSSEGTLDNGPMGADYPRDISLSPSIRVQPLDTAIPAIPLDKIAAFLSESRIVSDPEYEAAPYVLAGGAEHLILGAGDTLYSRGKISADVAVFGIYRKGDVYLDPETKEILGYQAIDIASAKLLSTQPDDVSTMMLTRTTQEVRVGDRLLPNEEHRINSTFYPSAPAEIVSGVILAVEGGVTQIGNMDIVVINRGVRDGLEVGNIMAVNKKGLFIKDHIGGDKITLPEEHAGLLMIFRTFEKMSYGLVLTANRPMAIFDVVKNP